MNAAAPFFSVVIPVFNRAGMLGNALRSILAQTCRDFEIIVVDDGSTDNPRRIVEQFFDPCIRFIRQDNRGGGAARNTGIDNAHGRYMAFLDSDDEFLPDHLETMRRLVEGTHNIVGYARILVDRGHGRVFLKPPRAVRADEHIATYLLCDRGFVPTITVVAEAGMAKNVRYDEALLFGEDKDFAIRLYLAGCRFVMAENPGAIWKDVDDPGRTSSGRKGIRLQQWIERLRPNIPVKAYYGCRGWVIAKGVATKDPVGALRLYLNALWHGCYRPRLALVIFLQIFLPDSLYRRMADTAISWFRLNKRMQSAA